MMRSVVFVAALCSFAGAAFAQGTKPITFECSYNKTINRIEIHGNNPNPVVRTCKAKCTYTNKEKKSLFYECQGAALNVGQKKFMCAFMPEGSAPYSNLKATGSC